MLKAHWSFLLSAEVLTSGAQASAADGFNSALFGLPNFMPLALFVCSDSEAELSAVEVEDFFYFWRSCWVLNF